MKHFKVILLLSLLNINAIIAQEFGVYNTVQQSKNKGNSFKAISNVFTEANKSQDITSSFKSADDVTLLDYNFTAIKKEKAKTVSLSIPHKSKGLVIDLIEVDEKFFAYDISTSFGNQLKPKPNRNCKHYRGIVRGEKNSLVAISFFENNVMGIISTNEGNLNIGKLEKTDQIILYNESNLLKRPDFICGTAHDKLKERWEKTSMEIGSGLTNEDCVRLYFETEFDMFLYFGNTLGVEQFVTALFNQVAVLYANENINVQLSAIFIWCCPDPYNAYNTACLLQQFQYQTNAIPGDLGQLLTFRNVGGGRAAGFNGLCNSNVDESLSVSGLHATGSVVPVPQYSWNVQLVTHEFGHLFGSRHTHACVWNGNGTAIDGCAGFTEGPCALPGYPAGGTIMSYCHLPGRPGINFNLGFGPQPGNVIRNRVANAHCLYSCTNEPPQVDLSHDCCNTVYQCVITYPPGSDLENSFSPEKRNIEANEIDYINLSLNVKPNPSIGNIDLQLKIPESSALNITVYDVSGNSVYTESAYALKGDYNRRIELPGYINSGTYIINVKVGKHTASQKLIVIK